jgi:hypothetical protein
MTVACLPSLRPVYRLVFHGSVKSPQQSGYHPTSRNHTSNLQTLNTFKKTYSDSTRQLAVIDGDGSRSFTEALDASSRSTDTTCEMDNMSPTQAHEKKNAIMVKNEVEVRLSARDAAART